MVVSGLISRDVKIDSRSRDRAFTAGRSVGCWGISIRELGVEVSRSTSNAALTAPLRLTF